MTNNTNHGPGKNSPEQSSQDNPEQNVMKLRRDKQANQGWRVLSQSVSQRQIHETITGMTLIYGIGCCSGRVCPCSRKQLKYRSSSTWALEFVPVRTFLHPSIHPTKNSWLVPRWLLRMKVKWRKTMHASLEGASLCGHHGHCFSYAGC